MRTDALALLIAACAAAPVDAQTREIERAVIGDVRFVIEGNATLSADDLRARITTRGRGSLVGWRETFGWVPFVAPVSEQTLDPVELYRDRERLRREFARRGYPAAIVDLDLSPVRADGSIDVTFNIRPGLPLIIGAVALDLPDAAHALDSAALHRIATARPGLRVGVPLDSGDIEPARADIARWLADRGRPATHVDVVLDTAPGNVTRLRFSVVPGPPVRIGDIAVSGSDRLEPRDLVRFGGVQPGEPFSLSRLEEAGADLAALDAVRHASFRVHRETSTDSVVNLDLRIVEEEIREVTGEGGYTSDGGLAGEAQWTHRSVFGGPQTLTATLAGQSGVWALGENPEQFIRGTLGLRMPIGSRARLSVSVAPFVGYRDDYRDRSLDYGVQVALIRQFGGFGNLALSYELTTRRVYEYRFGSFGGGVDFLELLQLSAEGVLDSLGARIDRSTLSLSASIGRLDSPTEPRRGFIIEPTLSAAVPAGLTSIEYFAAGFRASGYVPATSSIGLAGRIGADRLWPFGESIPPSVDNALREYFRLRDVLLTAGGTNDVRGWSDGLLGPKFPQVVFVQEEDSTVGVRADRYAPIGAFQRVFGTLEARWRPPLFGGRVALHSFLDGGRVWTTDARFGEGEPSPLELEDVFWGAGGGVDVATPVGTVRLSAGYKLNPSLLDLVSAQDFTDAIVEGRSYDDLPRSAWRRMQIHIGLGTRL